jgi:solute carrier family 6 GABA transporter-like protein 1
MAEQEKPQMGMGRRIWLAIAPDASKDEDGRDNFNSRSQFVLCAMGGAVGLGNLLRFPSVVYNNYGLQFFIPYFIALFVIGIPILTLQIVLGQTYRAGCVTAWNGLNRRCRGIGFSEVFNGFAVVGYYVPILAYAMNYFRVSFQSPLPWVGYGDDPEMATRGFFYNEVVQVQFPTGDKEAGEWASYGGSGLVGETVAWCFFTWAITWMLTFKGVGLTGRAIYFTMAMPLVMIFILAVRSLSLPNASDGFKLYVGIWRTESLNGGKVWQDAFGQMFFSIGVGFGYFTSYASYSSKYSNAVQDAFIIALSNSAIEIISALAVMGVVGYLGITPDPANPLSTFTSGFFTYPQALAEMPSPNFWSAIFFLTLWILGLTCVIALYEVTVTMIADTDWAKRWTGGRRWPIATFVATLGFLTSLIYCSVQGGFFLLDAVDMFVNDVALFYTVWFEMACATTLYRWRDPVDQIGLVSYSIFNGGWVFAQLAGLLVGQTVSAGAGAGVGFGIFAIAVIATAFVGKTPTVAPPGFWAKNAILSRLWYAAFYSGNQLKRDINRAIWIKGNWKLHWAWPALLKYITAPAVSLVLSFAYPKMYAGNYHRDPPYLYSFILMHMVLLFISSCFIMPKFLDFLVPVTRRGEGKYDVMPRVVIGETPVVHLAGVEHGYQNETQYDNAVTGGSTSSDGAHQTKIVDEAPRQEKNVL